jgi:putative membrane protein
MAAGTGQDAGIGKPGPEVTMKQLRKILTAVILIAAVALGVLFALQNKEAVPLDLLFFSFAPRSLALWLLVAFALGGLAGLLVSSFYLLRSRAALGTSRRQLARAQAELQQLRAAATPSAELKVSE